MPKRIVIKRALVSVSDKTGLIDFAGNLAKKKVEIISTGGTLKALKEAGIPATPVEKVTGFPEILEGRVKTLHPKIHGGLLFLRHKQKQVAEAKKHKIVPIDLVVVNLYPFESVTRNPQVTLEEAIENIDIGGPSMLRSAAKNHESVTVVCDPADYNRVLSDMEKNKGAVSEALNRELAAKVFAKTSAYDHAIHQFLNGKQSKTAQSNAVSSDNALPGELGVVYVKSQELRYGENPHQRAALYQAKDRAPRFQFKQLHGKELSFNNLLDIEAAVDILREFSEPAAAVVKHNNPCGIAEGKNLAEAVEKAIACDAMSAFGGIIAVNRPCDETSAKTALDLLPFFEVFIAPSFDKKAVALMSARKNLRIIETGELGAGGPFDMKFFKGGILLQDRDKPVISDIKNFKKDLKFVTKKTLKDSELEDLIFAWKCVKTVKSNAIVLVNGRQTVGIGAGQMSRVDSVFMACHKAGAKAAGSLLGSDAFFPMPDAIEEASRHKIRAIIQPGGSVTDADIIAACDKFGIAMAFTGKRHFRH